ncbi:MAG: amino acid ABC transporter ATP-binding protein [Lachnospiraceae bacterium]|nr:amino acid ABC transporter ATP-binding protein [Lachnospiraceae bacterium]
MIRIEHLQKTYPGVTPLVDVNATIDDGNVIAVIGPSGTGKSTLLRCINLLERPSGGDIWLDETKITDPKCDMESVRRRIGMVFQSFNLFPHLTVIGNIMLAQVDILKRSRQEAYDRGMELLQMVGLSKKAYSYPEELSGGQKQRIAIARTLAMDPDVLLLDEPTSALDPTMVGEVQAVISELAKSGRTMMIVTHEMEFARAVANRVFYMDEGVIYEDGTPEEIFEDPKKELTRRFVRKLKVFEAVIEKRRHDFVEFGAQLDRYLQKNDAPPAVKYRIRLAIEELVQQILLPHYKEPFIRIRAAYEKQNRTCSLVVTYKGEPFDIGDTDNTLSLSILQSTSAELKYAFDEKEEEPNRVEILLGAPKV